MTRATMGFSTTLASANAPLIAPVLTLVLGLAAFGACGSKGPTQLAGTTSSSSASSGGFDGGSGGAAWGASPCATCVQSACAAQIGACNADPECPSFLECLDACPMTKGGDPDASCAAACPVGTGTEAKRAAASFNACRTQGAGASCAACATVEEPMYTCPVLNQVCPNPSSETNPCFKCEDEKCCDSYAACKSNAECEALKQCIVDCVNASGDMCEKTCVGMHPDGANDWGALNGCMFVNCAADTKDCLQSERDPCTECLYSTCGDSEACFFSGADGYALYACIVACPIDDSACDSTCYAAYPSASDLYMKIGACVEIECKGKC